MLTELTAECTNGEPPQGPTSVQPERYAPPNSYYGSYYPPSSHHGPHPAPDMHNGGPPPNMTSGFHGPPPTGPPPPSDHPGYRPPMYYPGQYPPGHHPSHMGYMRPPYQPEHMAPHGPDSWRFRQPYPGNPPPPGPTIYGEQTIHRYPANAVQPPYQPSPAPRLQVCPAAFTFLFSRRHFLRNHINYSIQYFTHHI